MHFTLKELGEVVVLDAFREGHACAYLLLINVLRVSPWTVLGGKATVWGMISILMAMTQ